MFCPTCGIDNQGQVKFCRRCGANLSFVREALDRGTTKMAQAQSQPAPKKLVVQSLLKKIEETRPSDHTEWGEQLLPKLIARLEELTMTPEERRQKSIRRGLLTTGVGVGVSVFLSLFLEALAETGFIPEEIAPILRASWSIGLIPVFVGLMMALSGLLAGRSDRAVSREPAGTESASKRSTDRSIPEPRAGFGSVTEQTTTHLELPEVETSKQQIGRRPATEK